MLWVLEWKKTFFLKNIQSEQKYSYIPLITFYFDTTSKFTIFYRGFMIGKMSFAVSQNLEKRTHQAFAFKECFRKPHVTKHTISSVRNGGGSFMVRGGFSFSGAISSWGNGWSWKQENPQRIFLFSKQKAGAAAVGTEAFSTSGVKHSFNIMHKSSSTDQTYASHTFQIFIWKYLCYVKHKYAVLSVVMWQCEFKNFCKKLYGAQKILKT